MNIHKFAPLVILTLSISLYSCGQTKSKETKTQSPKMETINAANIDTIT